MASHPIPLPDALQSNLQVTLVAIIKAALPWRRAQSALSPASDCFKVTEGKGREREKQREKERERRDRCEPEGDGAIVKKPRDKCKIDSDRGCLLKCNRWLLTAGEKNLHPHLFLKKRHSRVLAFRIIWLIYFFRLATILQQ